VFRGVCHVALIVALWLLTLLLWFFQYYHINLREALPNRNIRYVSVITAFCGFLTLSLFLLAMNEVLLDERIPGFIVMLPALLFTGFTFLGLLTGSIIAFRARILMSEKPQLIMLLLVALDVFVALFLFALRLQLGTDVLHVAWAFIPLFLIEIAVFCVFCHLLVGR
jgi:hypothetical protein